MRFRFKAKRLAALYYDNRGAKRYPSQVVDSFFEVMAVIESAPDERDLYAFKSFHFERLEGEQDRRSIRLNRQYRLVLTIEQDAQGHYVLIIEINKHYA